MRLLFVTKALGYGGSEQHLVEVIRCLQHSDIDMTVLCYGKDVYSGMLDRGGRARVRVDTGTGTPIIMSYWRQFAELRPDIIVFVHGYPGLFPASAYLAARLSGAKRVVGIQHSVPFAVKDGWVRRWVARHAKYLLRRSIPGYLCHATISVSNAVRELLIDVCLFPPNKTLTVWNGVDIEYYGDAKEQSLKVREQFNIQPGDDVVICVSRLNRWKNIDVLLKAMSIVRKDHPACKCLIVGGGELEHSLRQLASDLDLQSAIFIGHVDDVRPYLGAGSIFVLPSAREGLPLVILEAMAAGLSCIATDVGGNREIIEHGDSGLIVGPGSESELAAAIGYLITHKEAALKMSIKARERVENTFNLQESLSRLKSVILGESNGEAGMGVSVTGRQLG